MAKVQAKVEKPGQNGNLEQRRKELLKRRGEILKEARSQIADSINGDTRQLMDTALDEGDLAEIAIQEDVNLSRLSIYRKTLRDIDEVLRKINEGSYGVCEECGGEISENRLAVMPTARFCISCQETKEMLEKAEGETEGFNEPVGS